MKLAAALIVLTSVTGCASADLSSMKSWGARHHVKQFSGGVLVGEWTSKGRILNEKSSDGYYFEDEKTGNPVMVSGTVQITLEK
jgi:hypothetical protein